MKYGLYITASLFSRSDVFQNVIQLLSDENTVWHADCLDCIDDGRMQNNSILSAEELCSAIEDAQPIIFARMIGLPAGQTPDRAIRTYDDYKASNCLHIVICVDCGCFEVYSKDICRLDTISRSLNSDWLDDVRWMHTRDGIDRTDFVVY